MSLNCFQYYVAICNCQFTKHTTPTTCIVALLHIFAKLALIVEFRSECSYSMFRALEPLIYLHLCLFFNADLYLNVNLYLNVVRSAEFHCLNVAPALKMPSLPSHSSSQLCLPPSLTVFVFLYFFNIDQRQLYLIIVHFLVKCEQLIGTWRGREIRMTVIVRHGARGLLLSHLNVEKMFVVDRFLPPSPPPPFSRGFIAAKMI